jgi:hypothetical protein
MTGKERAMTYGDTRARGILQRISVILCIGALATLVLPVAASQMYSEPNGTYALTLPDG